MKAIRGIYRVIISILMPLLLIAFIVTLFSFTCAYAYDTSAVSSASRVTITVEGTLSFISPLLKGSDLSLTYITTGEVSNVRLDSSGGVAYDMAITGSDLNFNPMSFALNMYALIGAVAVFIGVIMLLSTRKFFGSFLSTLLLIGGSAIIFIQGDAFSPFHFVIASSSSSSTPLINVSVPYLSTGILLIAMSLLSLLNSLLLVFKKKD